MIRPSATFSITEVRVKRGETLTVWLQCDEKWTQVEIRVTDAGEYEVFSTVPEKVRLQSFDFWNPMP